MPNITFDLYPEGKKKAITLGYDDGKITDKRLISLFDEYGFKCTFFINSGLLGVGERIPRDEIKEVYKNHEIAAHSLTHPHFLKLPKENIMREIYEDKNQLEKIVSYPIRGFTCPYGETSEQIFNMMRSVSVEFSRSIVSTRNFNLPDNPLNWKPTCHHRENLAERCDAFLNLSNPHSLPLLYVWGHSYEFEINNNWDIIEDFCRKAGNKNDIWYAANSKILEYIAALKALKFTLDNDVVYNPTSTDVWFSVDGKPVKASAGKMKKF